VLSIFFHYLHTVKSYIFFLVVFLFVSCADMKRPKQLKEIERIEANLNDAEMVLNSISIDSIEQIIRSSTFLENRIKKYYSGDTISLSLGEDLELFHALIPNSEEVVFGVIKIDSMLLFRKSQLNLLKNDIQQGAGNRSEYDENIFFENEEVSVVANFANFYDSLATASLTTFNNLHIEVEKFSIKCEKEFKIQQKLQ